jgi:hypothetical protein
MWSHIRWTASANGPNIDARFQTLDSTSENGSHIGAGENLSFDQTLKKGRAYSHHWHRYALSAATEEVDHVSYGPSLPASMFKPSRT